MIKIFAPLAALVAAATASPVDFGPSTTSAYCTTGTPVVTAGYTINYAPAEPTVIQSGVGYKPEATWASQHVAATYTYGVPDPKETGFAYAQFKCQYTCNSAPGGSSFFVEYIGGQVGSSCTCYTELLFPETFVAGNQTMVGGWNAICD
ncbi:hypothetical protein PFICI_10897 [Pestalotiopsis fici W106-1]|uniref:Uncharacterized protein n=1 Tax=Pestalotiopsis fici (strain W106-1 / CGMCC3.15140) TaxID=1229662 RepID=W3WT20_PESFW|nr:uncharacterized protein PFICI_10897 [Pestalotiopsis fici W106-1]ETS77023.1 hypothetical protein PFICI_10897 [Pestalotiopsis fici W106-1]